MEDNKQRSFTIPLVELVIVVGIFAVVSVILMRMYLSADNLRGRAVTISRETVLCENDFELLKDKLSSMSAEDAAKALGYSPDGGAYVKEVSDTGEDRSDPYVMKMNITKDSADGAPGELYNVTLNIAHGEEENSFSTSIYAKR
ncbi:MAG: type II secretion system protein [Lachnospiraceae bacterium]|nr:type II secretion system protein [Lachnospiraceae bacterium]